MLTFEKAKEIIKNTESFTFREKKVKDFTAYVFNYILPNVSEFNSTTIEFRGAAYIKELNLWIPSIHKFFNHCENEFVREPLSNDIEVIEKLDGSLITAFMVDNQIILKSKTSFDNKFTELAYSIINDRYKAFIKDLYQQGMVPFFELLTNIPDMSIVVYYQTSSLVLTQIRQLNNNKEFILGDYVPYEELSYIAKQYNIPFAKRYDYTKDQIDKIIKTQKGIEGFVIVNKNSNTLFQKFQKMKTQWYMDLHKLNNDINRSDIIIKLTMNEEIDDAISKINNPEKRNEVLKIHNKIRAHFNNIVKQYSPYLAEKSLIPRKEFALKYKNLKYFDVLMRSNNEAELISNLKKAFLKKTKTLSNAEKFIDEIEIEVEI